MAIMEFQIHPNVLNIEASSLFKVLSRNQKNENFLRQQNATTTIDLMAGYLQLNFKKKKLQLPQHCMFWSFEKSVLITHSQLCLDDQAQTLN